MKFFNILLIFIFILFGICLGSAYTSIYMTEMLEKFPTLVVGVLAACFAFLGVVLSQIWQSKNIDKTIKAQSENLSSQLEKQQKIFNEQIFHASKLQEDKLLAERNFKREEFLKEKLEELYIAFLSWVEFKVVNNKNFVHYADLGLIKEYHDSRIQEEKEFNLGVKQAELAYKIEVTIKLYFPNISDNFKEIAQINNVIEGIINYSGQMLDHKRMDKITLKELADQVDMNSQEFHEKSFRFYDLFIEEVQKIS